jgi:protein-S-isoprenylcysteine O-methyltransferase Ste14
MSRKLPPFVFIIVPVFLVMLSLSVFITWVMALPRRLPIPTFIALPIGIILLVFGSVWMFWAIKTLGIRRATGKEVFKSSSDSTLITTGPYAWCRNPLYFSATGLFLGWFFVFRWTSLAILTVLFLIWFFFIAKWEQRELTMRFGAEFEEYRQRVPFFFPVLRPKLQVRNRGKDND